MKMIKDLDSVGWRFFGLCTVLLYGPNFYFFWTSMYEEKRSTTVPYVFPLITSVVLAGFIAAGVNSFLQNRAEAREQVREQEVVTKKRKDKNG